MRKKILRVRSYQGVVRCEIVMPVVLLLSVVYMMASTTQSRLATVSCVQGMGLTTSEAAAEDFNTGINVRQIIGSPFLKVPTAFREEADSSAAREVRRFQLGSTNLRVSIGRFSFGASISISGQGVFPSGEVAQTQRGLSLGARWEDILSLYGCPDRCYGTARTDILEYYCLDKDTEGRWTLRFLLGEDARIYSMSISLVGIDSSQKTRRAGCRR